MKINHGSTLPRRMPILSITFALIAMRLSAGNARVSPMEKVVELLDVLAEEIQVEGKEEAKAYADYTLHYRKDRRETMLVIQKYKVKVDQLETDLKEAKAFREGKKMELAELANELTKNDIELTTGKNVRRKERAAFVNNEATFVDSIRQLKHALEVMKKKMPGEVSVSASASASSASLVSVAEHLEKTLTHGSDFSLSASERETLNNFVQTAYVSKEFRDSDGHKSWAAPSFLQKKLQVQEEILHRWAQALGGPYGDYQSKSGGLVSTLQQLLGKVEKERDAALKSETISLKDFKTFEAGLEEMIENGEKSMSNTKSTIAQSQQESSQQETSLIEAKELFKSEVAHAEEIMMAFRVETQAYKQRLGKRLDETVAVQSAKRMLRTAALESAPRLLGIGSRLHRATQGSMGLHNGASFLEVKATVRTKTGVKVTVRAKSGVKATARAKSGVKADPFVKVKSMVRGMLEKLSDKQAEESTHAAWCDKEMSKTAKEQIRKEGDAQKTGDRLEALSADLMEIASDMQEVSKDMKSLSNETAEARSIREEEHKQATFAMSRYRNGAGQLRRGCDILKAFYGKKTIEGSDNPKVDTNAFKQRRGLGAGIVGILEVAIDDFDKLYLEAKADEDAAATDFKEAQSRAAVRSAVFQKNLEWKTRTKVKLEFDQSQMRNDLKSSEKELSAITSYMEKLKASCIVAGPSYEERDAKRKEELASLKDVLAVLRSED